jgi:hypothetical protein
VTTAYDDDDAIEAEVVEQTARIVQLRKTLPPPLALEAATEPEPASRARDLVKRVARPLPGPKRMGRVTLWWTLHLAMVLPWLPKLAFQELWPIGRGVRIVCSGWANWVQATRRHEYAKEAEGNTKTKYGTAAEKTAVARKWGSAAFAAILAGVGVWLWNTHPGYLLVAGILALAGLDLLGRADTPVQKSAPAMPRVLSENVPLRQVEASVLAALEREGFPEGSVRVAEPMWWDETRRQYEISLSLADQLRPEHLRAVERAIGARDHAIRNLATDTATVRRLVIVVGDPLAALSERPFIPTGTRSIVQPVELGESMTEVPFALPSAGVHWRVVAGTGGGKTKWVLRSTIDAESACHDVVLGGIDITNGPELALWRGVIQHRGFTVEEADAVLDIALAEIDRRSKILAAIAEDDDPDNDVDEWHSGLGPYFDIFVDEFSQLAEYDGTGAKKYEPNLLGKCELIVRTGRKHGVSLKMFTQRTGNDDFGSTTMSSQCGVSICGPCDPADTVRMFGVERRDAGYTPHLLSPGVEGDIRDAGKVFIDSPMHRTPDIYRAYAPGTTAEVKRRARQRMDDGLPTLDSGPEIEVGTVEAVEVPPILAAVEDAFHAAGNPDRMATTIELLPRLREAGFDLDENRLAAELRPTGLRSAKNRWTPPGGGNPVRGYLRGDVETAIRRLQ